MHERNPRSPPQSHIDILEHQASHGIRSAMSTLASMQRRNGYKRAEERPTDRQIHKMLSTTGALLRAADGRAVVVKLPKTDAIECCVSGAGITKTSWLDSCWAYMAVLRSQVPLLSATEA